MSVSKGAKRMNCPHCHGKTKCDCLSCCGSDTENTRYGICKVCSGHGKVSNPDYDPNYKYVPGA